MNNKNLRNLFEGVCAGATAALIVGSGLAYFDAPTHLIIACTAAALLSSTLSAVFRAAADKPPSRENDEAAPTPPPLKGLEL